VSTVIAFTIAAVIFGGGGLLIGFILGVDSRKK